MIFDLVRCFTVFNSFQFGYNIELTRDSTEGEKTICDLRFAKDCLEMLNNRTFADNQNN